jgi:tetratricopeptide (TPR) repeat protein
LEAAQSARLLAVILPQKIMKETIFTIITLCLFQNSFAQDEIEINFDEIKTKVENVNSESYYPKLLKRFNEFDSALSLEENALIYYGFSFQVNYILNKPNEEKLSALSNDKDYEKLKIECQKILERNPVSLEANNKMGYALFKLGKPEIEWKKYQKRYKDIRKVIVYSGNGLSCESAFKVIYVSDEYNIIYDYFEITKVEQQSLVGTCDKLLIEPSNFYKVKEIYFDASRSLIRNEEILNKKK